MGGKVSHSGPVPAKSTHQTKPKSSQSFTESTSGLSSACEDNDEDFNVFCFEDYLVVNSDALDTRKTKSVPKAVNTKQARAPSIAESPLFSHGAQNLSYAEQLCLKNEEIKATLSTWKKDQVRLRNKLIVDNTFDLSEIKYIGGVDISFPECKDDLVHACACLVVHSYPDMELVYQDCEMVHLTSIYIPEFLGFRETSSLVDLVMKLRFEKPHLEPQVILVDGNGILHPRGFGTASHLGVLLGVPTIGVAKKLFHVDGLENSPEHKAKIRTCLCKAGDTFPLIGNSGKTLGMAVRSSQSSTNPIYVSIGHKSSLQTAVDIVYVCCKYRIPEPVRQADILSREFIRTHYYKHTAMCAGHEELNNRFLELSSLRVK